MLVSAARRLAASSRGSALSRVASAAVSRRHFIASSEDFGTHQFSGAVADEYLSKQGLPAGTLDDPKWTTTSADKVAAAVMDWAHDKGASVYTHWFQPLGASGLRHGLSGQVQNAMFAFGPDGKVKHEFKGKELLKGETDGSSYPNGGMRATHTAGGYTIIDPTSPIFLRGDTVFIPTVFVSFYGDALDEKTPLLRSMRAVSDEACRLLKHLGLDAKKVQPNIGLEQEFFFVPRKEYYRRPDLQFAGRTVMGKLAPRGQETCDHYMSAINPVALACMQEVQHECMMMGIPLRTRHREVAPNQYEFAPLFGLATTQIDQNLQVMQILEEVAARHGLAALIEEKPFTDINGAPAAPLLPIHPFYLALAPPPRSRVARPLGAPPRAPSAPPPPTPSSQPPILTQPPCIHPSAAQARASTTTSPSARTRASTCSTWASSPRRRATPRRSRSSWRASCAPSTCTAT